MNIARVRNRDLKRPGTWRPGLNASGDADLPFATDCLLRVERSRLAPNSAEKSNISGEDFVRGQFYNIVDLP